VGVQSNAWNRLATPPELEAALRDGLGRCGVKPVDISVDDRGVRSNPVFARATAKDPAMRYPTWEDFAADLRH
jgi:hypothetical protein